MAETQQQHGLTGTPPRAPERAAERRVLALLSEAAARQREVEVTGQNITNVDVPGYSRQEAIIRSVPGAGGEVLDDAGNPVAPGGGIDVALVQRSHAAWLDQAAARLQAQVGQQTAGD